MVNRYLAKAFVPSAGTGFVLSRKTLAHFGAEDVLPNNSLTEDYRLALTLFENNIRLYYVLERIPRVDNKWRVVWDYVTTRSMFPNTFKTAVRQKARWIMGITMQSVRFRDIFLTKGLPFSGRYSLYKDLKAKAGNMLSMIGYPVLVYFFVSLFLPLQPIFPLGTLSWWMSLAITVMMLERQLFRAIGIFHVYGMRSVFFACLFPPIFPIRLIWGNIINWAATMRAFRQKYFGKKKEAKKAKARRGIAARADQVGENGSRVSGKAGAQAVPAHRRRYSAGARLREHRRAENRAEARREKRGTDRRVSAQTRPDRGRRVAGRIVQDQSYAACQRQAFGAVRTGAVCELV